MEVYKSACIIVIRNPIPTHKGVSPTGTGFLGLYSGSYFGFGLLNGKNSCITLKHLSH